MSGGKGGTGGGVGVGSGCWDAGRACCRDTTGGSFANMSLSIARKSSNDDFYAADISIFARREILYIS